MNLKSQFCESTFREVKNFQKNGQKIFRGHSFRLKKCILAANAAEIPKIMSVNGSQQVGCSSVVYMDK